VYLTDGARIGGGGGGDKGRLEVGEEGWQDPPAVAGKS
jgi:hypothetical protein